MTSIIGGVLNAFFVKAHHMTNLSGRIRLAKRSTYVRVLVSSIFTKEMCNSIQRKRLTLLAIVSFAVFIVQLPTGVAGLKENEVVIDDFDSGTSNYWNFNQESNSTEWYLSMHGDPAPYGIVGLRPPNEPNGGGFVEVVPLSDSPAIITTTEFELLPGARVDLVYWNAANIYTEGRKTTLLLYTENVENGIRTSVFIAPLPESSYPDWITRTIDLRITEPSIVRLQLRGFRVELEDTGLAVSKVTIKNGIEQTTTTKTTVTTFQTLPMSETPGTPTQYEVESPNPTTPLTITISSSTTVESSSPTAISQTSTLSSSSLGSSIAPTSPTSTLTPTDITTFTSSTQSTSTSSSTITFSSTSSIPTTNKVTSFTTESSTVFSQTLSTDQTEEITASSIASSTETPIVTSTASPSNGSEMSNTTKIGIGVGVSLFAVLLIFFSIIVIRWYRDRQRRIYLIEHGKLVDGHFRPLPNQGVGIAIVNPSSSSNASTTAVKSNKSDLSSSSSTISDSYLTSEYSNHRSFTFPNLFRPNSASHLKTTQLY